MPDTMHRHDPDDPEAKRFAEAVFAFARQRIAADALPGGLPMGDPQRPEALDAAVGATITPEGLGGLEALRIFQEHLEPACLSIDHPGFLAFVPQAPTETAILGDLVVAACSIYAGSWLEGGGAVWAEHQALLWLAEVFGLPPGAGGVFVQGGTNGNLSALVAAREAARHRRLAAGLPARPDGGWAIVCGSESHASVTQMANVMDAEVVSVDGERLTGQAVTDVLARLGERVAAVVTTAGSTNLGRIDRIDEVADACAATGTWLHVDGAYGLAAMLVEEERWRFAGVERADSVIVDPHKWLFTPFDACALLYRDPDLGRAAHTQKGDYLEVLTSSGDPNPSDHAVQLSRRARGVPLWFSLATHGENAYRDAVAHGLALARTTAGMVADHPGLSLIEEPELSVVGFTVDGWTADDLEAWSQRLLDDGIAFVVPSAHRGAPIVRLCFVNPRTTVELVERILATLP